MGCLSFAARSSAFERHNHRQIILCSCGSCCYCHLSTDLLYPVEEIQSQSAWALGYCDLYTNVVL